MRLMKENAALLNETFREKSPEEVLAYFLHAYGSRVALASSMGVEDQVLTDMMLKIDPLARIFTIDTGRLFPETYSLIDRTNMHYGIRMEVYFPESGAVERFVQAEGINAFYESVEKRKECCRIRKIAPLKRALSTLDAWICGLRQEQSVTRTGVQVVEWDGTNGLLKINPLARCSEQEVWAYAKSRRTPYSALHDLGYPSIGCCPCTRAVSAGEDIRSGRWWWENPEHRECGLHRR